MSSSAGPSRVNRPRRSSASISNGSTASSTGTADGARTGASALLFVSGDCETMALYLGVEEVERKGGGDIKSIVVPANAGTHNHRRKLSCKAFATSLKKINRAVWVPACHLR